MPDTETAPSASRHRPRMMIGFTPEVYDALSDYADAKRQAARWAAHDIVLRFLVAEGRITQADSDRMWRALTRRKDTD